MTTTETQLPVSAPEGAAAQHKPKDQDQFDETVRNCEELARSNFGAYMRKVISFALLGYAFIFSIPFILVGLTVVAFGLVFLGHAWFLGKVAFGLLIAVIFYLKSLWVRIAPPEGIYISRHQAPKFFELTDELQSRLGVAIDKVAVIPEMQAAVVQLPRLGLFGWYQNYLLVGLPLMQVLSIDEFKSVLAHELGHLSGNHGKTSAWLYTQRARWAQLLAAMSERSQLAFAMMARFFKWYEPRYLAYTMVIARKQEREADLMANEVTDVSTFGTALIKTAFFGTVMDMDVPTTFDRLVHTQDYPPTNFYDILVSKLRSLEGISTTRQVGVIKNLLAGETDKWDTHPSLLERLTVSGFQKNYNLQAESLLRQITSTVDNPSAADALLDTELQLLCSQFNKQMFNQVDKGWQGAHEQAQANLARLAELQSKEETLEVLEEKAELLTNTSQIEESVQTLHKVLALDPNNVHARTRIGSVLYREGLFEEALPYILPGTETLVPQSLSCIDATISCYDLLGRKSEANRFRILRGYVEELSMHATVERIMLSATSKYVPAILTVDELEKLRTFMRTMKLVKKAYIVRREFEFGGQESAPLLVMLELKWCSEQDRADISNLVASNAPINDEFVVVIAESESKAFNESIRQVAQSAFYASS